MKITKIGMQQVNTSYGQKQKFVVTATDGQKTVTFDSWVGNWNKNWQVGDEIEATKEQWKSRDYNGKTYWSLAAPESARYGGANPQEIQALRKEIAAVRNLVEDFITTYDPLLSQLKNERTPKNPDMPTAAPMEEDEIPTIDIDDNGNDDFGGQDEVRLEDVPF